jgi:hypothetical protein
MVTACPASSIHGEQRQMIKKNLTGLSNHHA